MILLARPSSKREEVRSRLVGHLSSGRAYEVFAKVIAAQGGDVRQIENTSLLPQAAVRFEVNASDNGVVAGCDVRELGLAIIELGGGRLKSTDKINPAVGLSKLKRVGDIVRKGDPLAVIHADSQDMAEKVAGRVSKAYRVAGSASAEPLIWRII
jgi:thymidine phosphorylase